MIKIDQERLQLYMKAFVDFEIAVHGIDPRVSLLGTSLRRQKDEGYKRTVHERFLEDGKAKQPRPYLDSVVDALPGGNLVDYRKKHIIEELAADADNRQRYEEALQKLYLSNEDEAAFSLLADCFGKQFDLLSFLFFLKDKEHYVPVRSELFDQRFLILGGNTQLSGNCSWENYQDINSAMLEIREQLSSFLQTNVTLLDAHSFFWILPAIKKFVSTGEAPKAYKKKNLKAGKPHGNRKQGKKAKGSDFELKREDELSPDEYPSLPEGAVKEISVTTFERNTKAIDLCKKHYMKNEGKLVCQICGFDFGAFYGEEYENMSHVHHTIPLSAIRENYVVDPVNDLLPICPNCHMVLHRFNKNLQREITVEELKERIRRRGGTNKYE